MSAAARHRGPAAREGRRALAVLCLFAAAAALLSVDAVHARLLHAIALAAPLFAAHPLSGRLAFIALAMCSAVLAFFSSTVIVPPAVVVWGAGETAFLLWAGWWLGGLATYALGRWMRQRVRRLLQRRLPGLRLPRRLSWTAVLLMQLALPSEVPGYVCGMLRVAFPTYASALALAELPYAAGAVLAAEGLVQARAGWLLGLGAAAALAMLGAWRLLAASRAGRDLGA